MRRPVRGVARAMLSAIFVTSGAQALARPETFTLRAKKVTDRLAPLIEKVDNRLPTDPTTLVRVNAAVQVGAGLLLATGRMTRPAAALLAGSLIPTTLAGHAFWLEDDPVQRRNHQIHFLKNLGLFGGLLLAAADTQGRPGMRWRRDHPTRSLTRRPTHRRGSGETT